MAGPLSGMPAGDDGEQLMNFPDNAVMQAIYWLLNTPGVGAVIVLLVGGGATVFFAGLLRWIQLGSKAPELETYSYPTPALLHSHEK